MYVICILSKYFGAGQKNIKHVGDTIHPIFGVQKYI